MLSVSRLAKRAVPRAACPLEGASVHARAVARGAWHLQAPTARSYSHSAPEAARRKGTTSEQTAVKSPNHRDGNITTGLAELTDNGRWTLAAEGAALERSFRFKNFTKTWDFMTAVALQCKLKNHHPEWSNVYNTVFVRWTTHSAPEPGLTAKDVEMAGICDGLGTAFGEVVEGAGKSAPTQTTTTKEPPTASTGDAGPTCKMQSLADTATGITGGDCCNHTPNSKSA